MGSPETFADGTIYPSAGERVIVRRLGPTDGFLIHPRPMSCRKLGAVGTATSYVPGHGGDVWWVEHDDGSVGAYCYEELAPLAAPATPPAPAASAVTRAERDVIEAAVAWTRKRPHDKKRHKGFWWARTKRPMLAHVADAPDYAEWRYTMVDVTEADKKSDGLVARLMDGGVRAHLNDESLFTGWEWYGPVKPPADDDAPRAHAEYDAVLALLAECRDLISRRMVAKGVNREQQAVQRAEARIVLQRIDAALRGKE